MTQALRLEVGCMLVLFFIIINYYSAKRRKTKTHIVYQALTAVAFANIVLDFLFAYFVSAHGVVYDWINKGYLITLALFTCGFHFYLRVSMFAQHMEIETKIRKFWNIPILVAALLVIFNKIEYVDVGNWYNSTGFPVIVIHVTIFVYLLDCVYLLLVNWKKTDKKSLIASSVSVLGVGIMMLIQLLDFYNITTAAAVTFGMLTLYVIIENPDQLLIEQLQYERDRANSANESKSSFIAHISHEIRTPINAILGMDEMILRETGDDQTKQYAYDIAQAAQSLYSIINDVLDMSKMESGKMDIFPVEYKLEEMLYDTISLIKPRVEAKQLDFYVEVYPMLPSCFYGDDVRIKQVLTNLLSNAVKYTHEGFIKLSVDGEFRGDLMNLHFEVKDTGIGIKEEDINRLFIAFERIEESRNRNIEGTGLGMNITNNLLRLMGSHLEVQSVYGEGSIFSFDVVQRIVNNDSIGDFNAYVKEQDKPNASTFTAPTVKLLVVDDNTLNRRVFRSLLLRTKINVDEADSGMKALNMIAKETYDIIFLDHLMPEMDGIDTINRIKADTTHPNVNTPVIMLTANAGKGLYEQYKHYGFDAYLAKPIFGNELEKLIKKFIPSYKIITDRKNGEDPNLWKEQLPKIRGIDWAEAIKHLPTKEILYATVKDFYKSIPSEADVMDAYVANLEKEDNSELFRIKTHALKSSAALLGMDMLSEGAKELEMAAKERNFGIINEKYPYMINYYRSFEEKLKVLDFGEEKKKTVIDFPQVLALLEMVRLEIFDMNKANADEAITEIDEYEYPVEITENIERLKGAVDEGDSELVSEIVDELQKQVRFLRG